MPTFLIVPLVGVAIDSVAKIASPELTAGWRAVKSRSSLVGVGGGSPPVGTEFHHGAIQLRAPDGTVLVPNVFARDAFLGGLPAGYLYQEVRALQLYNQAPWECTTWVRLERA